MVFGDTTIGDTILIIGGIGIIRLIGMLVGIPAGDGTLAGDGGIMTLGTLLIMEAITVVIMDTHTMVILITEGLTPPTMLAEEDILEVTTMLEEEWQ